MKTNTPVKERKTRHMSRAHWFRVRTFLLFGAIASVFALSLIFGSIDNGTSESAPASDSSKFTEIKDYNPKNKSSTSTGSNNTKIAVNNDNHNEVAQKIPEESILKNQVFPQFRYETLATVNDPGYSGNYSSNWYHSTIQTGRGWDISTGSSDTVIAVIDSGFALNHEDLVNKWHINSGETGTTQAGDFCHVTNPGNKASNNCDDDQNNYIDDWRGWDFSTGLIGPRGQIITVGDNNPQTGTVDPNGKGVEHGTMVSGLIAATANNGKGNAGIDQQAKLMPLMALDDGGSGYTNHIVLAIEYAVANGANIINMSLGGNSYDEALLKAVNDAKNAGVLVIVASGNCGNSSTGICSGLSAPGRITYPAKYTSTLSVGATNSGDARSVFSSYGAELDIVAPGEEVGPLAGWTASNQTSAYFVADGTSFASPIVAGIAGLVRSQMTNPTVDQLTNVLLDSADKITGLNGATRNNEYGYGRVNAHKATLLTKAIIIPPGTTGTTAIEARLPARGGITRSTTGVVASDEWSVIACRVEASDFCSAVVTNGANTLRINPVDQTKGASLYYMFVKGSSMQSGTSTLSVHNRHYATNVGTLSR
jgi:subtilisin family serine protease